MNILQVLPELNVGGVETGTVDFAKYLVRNNHRSVVISNGGKLVERLLKEGSKHYTLPVHKKSLFSILRQIGRVRKIIIKENIDVVHARSRVPAWIAYFACRKTNASFITTCHGAYNSKLFSQVMGWPKLIIVPSEAIGRHMIDQYHAHPEAIRVIPRGVDLEKFEIRRDPGRQKSECTIAIVGRITPLKGHTYFLEAMAKVIRSIPYAKVLIIGDTPSSKDAYKTELINLVNRLGLKDNVQFLGNRSDVSELLSKTDCLVFSSTVPESFGRVILEAQAVGVPVVATAVGGVVDIIDDGVTGLLVEPRDTDAMARQVIKVLDDRKLAQEMVVNARKKLMDKFTLKHMAEKTIAVYEELLCSTNILVIKISSIGDVVLVVPSLKCLRKNFPLAKIYVLVGKDSRKILQSCPYIDGTILYDAKGKDAGFFRLWKLSKKLRKYRFDKCIDFQNNKKSHLLSFLSFSRESYGFANGKWDFLVGNRLRKYRNDIPPVEHQYQLLNMLGVKPVQNTYLELWPTPKDEEYVKALLDEQWLGNRPRIVGISLAASANWPTKNWPIEYFAQLIDMLAGRNIRTIVTGVEKDRAYLNKLNSLVKTKPASFIGKTDVLQLAALIKHCSVFIAPDSAPLHVAAAVDVPAIAFFGPTDSTRHIPPARRIAVLERKLSCSPCYSGRCRILTHACMKDIEPEEMFSRVMEFMEVKA